MRYLTAGLAILLMGEFAAWHLLRYHLQTAVLISVLGALPWTLLLRDLWRGRRARYVTATLWIAPYLAYGVMELLANPRDRLLAIGCIVLAMALFLTITQFLRLSRPVPPTPN
jgi:uncharacterized membrane protein